MPRETDEPSYVAVLAGSGGAIAVVRLVGKLCEAFAAAHLTKSPVAGRAVRARLVDGSDEIDDVLVVGVGEEGLIDLNLHGGPWIVARTMRLAEEFGFERVDGADVRLADGATLLEREVAAAVPLARSEKGLRMLAAQADAWRELELRGITADRAAEMMRDRALWWMLNPPRVAIVGVPNAGKSTLANVLFGFDRSIVADLPGTTRDWVGDWADIGGLPVELIDTPGIRHSADQIEREAIDLSGAEVAKADLVIVVMDPTQPIEQQAVLLERFVGALVVVNEGDLAEPHPRMDCLISAKTGKGVDDLRRQIVARFVCDGINDQSARWWTERQRSMLEQIAAGAADQNSSRLTS